MSETDNLRQARALVHDLANGIDPRTRERLGDDHLCQRSDTTRALLWAIHALDEALARRLGPEESADVPETLQHSGTSTPSHAAREQRKLKADAALMADYQRGASIEALAMRHNQSMATIRSRLAGLGMRPRRPPMRSASPDEAEAMGAGRRTAPRGRAHQKL
ncbi:MAG: hypothetical protein AAFR70_12515 [Pseudomonadota bacterium]